MKIIENGVMRDMTPEEIAELEEFNNSEQQTESLMNQVRMDRAALLHEADIAILKGEDFGSDVTVWRNYRQQLRDITKYDPRRLVWPEKPV